MKFRTKEESNRAQQEEFLKLSGAERVVRFFELSRRMLRFPSRAKRDSSENFILEFKKKDEVGGKH